MLERGENDGKPFLSHSQFNRQLISAFMTNYKYSALVISTLTAPIATS